MNFRKTAIVAAALSLGAAPVAAQTTAPQISRASAETSDANGQFEGSFGIFAIASVLIIVGLVFVLSDSDDDNAASA